MQAYCKEKKSFESALSSRRKKIKAQSSFDAVYWTGHKEVVELEIKRHDLVRKISMNLFLADEGFEEEWVEQDKAEILREEKKELEMKNKLLEDHILRMKFLNENRERSHRKWLMELFTYAPTSKDDLGLGDVAGQERRKTSDQSRFREKLVAACNSKHSDEDVDWH